MPDELTGATGVAESAILFQDTGFGMGALPLPYDWRDNLMERAPGIAPFVGSAPASYDRLIPFIMGCYNQGSLPSCVIHSAAGMQSIFEQIEQTLWIVMDAVRAYYALGGNGSNGIDTRLSLGYFQTTGMPVVSSRAVYKIGTYSFTDPRTEQGIETIKAAISTNHPCVLAMRLPVDFMNGMNAGVGAVSPDPRNYHQVAIVAYTPERLIFLNSWGSTYGNNGLGSVPWDYLKRPEQNGYVYAYTVTDAKDDGAPVPVPIPIPVPIPFPIPQPVALTISGYLGGAAGTTVNYKGGQLLSVVGTGFDVGVIQVRLTEGDVVAVPSKSGTLLTFQLPAVTVPRLTALVVQREAVSVTGPPFVLTPNGQPQPQPDPLPPSSLRIVANATPVTGLPGSYKVVANARDDAGALVWCDWSGTIGGTPMPFYAHQQAAAWIVKTISGTRLVVNAVAQDGRKATFTRDLASA